MWRYLRAAVFVRPRLGALGNVPVVVLAAVGAGILGLAQPAVWFAAAGVLGAFVFALATSERFRKLVDARELAGAAEASAAHRQELVATLDGASRQRLAELRGRARGVLHLYGTHGSDAAVVEASREALERLEWIYLKLLLARRTLAGDASTATPGALRQEIASLEKELSRPMTPSVRASREATLDLVRKRLANAEAREGSLAEIDSDLERIEAQVELARDEAALRGKPVAIGANIEMAGRLLDTNLFGASAPMVLDLDARLGMGGTPERAAKE